MFVTHTEIERYFPKIVKSCSEYRKTCKAPKSRNLEFYENIIFSRFILENKNSTALCPSELYPHKFCQSLK